MSIELNGTLGVSLVQEPALAFVPKQNWIINGMFDVWQRGTSQTGNGYGSDDRYINNSIGSTKTHSQQAFAIGQIVVPNNPAYFSRTTVTSVTGAGNGVYKLQRIEDITKLAGKTVTLSFWAKADANKQIATELETNFGTGGSAGSVGIGVQKHSLTTSWQRFTKTIAVPSVSGKTIGTGNSLDLYFWFDAGSTFNTQSDTLGQQSGTFDIANVCLVEGSIPQECPNEPYAEVLRKCQRYYQRFETKTTGTDVFMSGYHKAGNVTTIYFYCSSIVPFRTVPTSVDYSANLNVWDPAVGLKTLTGITLYNSTLASISLGLLSNSAFTTGSMYLVVGAVAGSQAYIGISAEL